MNNESLKTVAMLAQDMSYEYNPELVQERLEDTLEEFGIDPDDINTGAYFGDSDRFVICVENCQADLVDSIRRSIEDLFEIEDSDFCGRIPGETRQFPDTA